MYCLIHLGRCKTLIESWHRNLDLRFEIANDVRHGYLLEMIPEKIGSGVILVGPSKVHGQGAFAGVFIPKGTVLPWENTREISQQEFSQLAPMEQKFTDLQNGKTYLVGVPERFVNHSCDNNTAPGILCDIALCDIQQGEEITSDYSNFFILTGSFACSCKSPRCRGTIIGRKNPD